MNRVNRDGVHVEVNHPVYQVSRNFLVLLLILRVRQVRSDCPPWQLFALLRQSHDSLHYSSFSSLRRLSFFEETSTWWGKRLWWWWWWWWWRKCPWVWRDEKFGLAEIRGRVFWDGMLASGVGRRCVYARGEKRTQRRGRGPLTFFYGRCCRMLDTSRIRRLTPAKSGTNENTKMKT